MLTNLVVIRLTLVLIYASHRVKLEGKDTTSLRIVGNVVEGSLELLSSQSDERIDCVNFGATYYGTDRTETAILYNSGPEPASFVAVLEENAIGQELVSL